MDGHPSFPRILITILIVSWGVLLGVARGVQSGYNQEMVWMRALTRIEIHTSPLR
jgi:hypothetical protein